MTLFTARERVGDRRYQGYIEWRRDRAHMDRLDEATDAAERLNTPMHTSLDYRFDIAGQLCYEGQPIEPVFTNGIYAAEALVARDPSLHFELTRRQMEYREYHDAVRFARQAEPSDILMVVSIIPDAVLAGSSIDGYHRQRLKTMLRIYQPISGGVRIHSLSLDRSDRDGLSAVAACFGETVATDEPSEAMLARRFLGSTARLGDDPVRELRRVYDAVLARKHGGTWFAGRQDGQLVNSYQFVLAQPQLLDAHMASLAAIDAMGLNPVAGRQLKEVARYDFAAALSEVMAGSTSARDVDIAAAGERARDDGKDFSSDCPTGLLTAEEAIATQFNRQDFAPGVCRVCLAEGLVGACSVCMGCEAADNRGESLDAIHRGAVTALASRRQTILPPERPRPATIPDVTMVNGTTFQLTGSRLVVGGRERLFIGPDGHTYSESELRR